MTWAYMLAIVVLLAALGYALRENHCLRLFINEWEEDFALGKDRCFQCEKPELEGIHVTKDQMRRVDLPTGSHVYEPARLMMRDQRNHLRYRLLEAVRAADRDSRRS